MHDHRFLRRVSLKRTKASLILLLDITQAAKLHLAGFASKRSGGSLPLDR